MPWVALAAEMESYMWTGQPITIDDWADFEPMLRAELARLQFNDPVLVRNFALETATVDEASLVQTGTVDRLDLVLKTGSDRDDTSSFWNAPGFDHDHDMAPSGKTPKDIIYAYPIDLRSTPYLVHVVGKWVQQDLTVSLEDQCGIAIYDASKVTRASNNEHWFTVDPCAALLAVFVPAPYDE